MDFGIDRVQVHCTNIAVSKSSCNRVELVALELELPQTLLFVHQVTLSFSIAALLPHIEAIGVDAARPVGNVAEQAAVRGRSGSGEAAPQEQLRPLVLVPRAGGSSGTALAAGVYGVCRGPLRLTLRCTATADPGELVQAALAELPSPPGEPGPAPPALERANTSVFSFLLRHTLSVVRVDALSLVRASITAAHLIPLLNAAQHLRAGGAAHQAEASEADLLAGLALMRCRKFVQCRELWQRRAHFLLETAGIGLAEEPPAEGAPDGGSCFLGAAGGAASLGCGLSISPFAHRISASRDLGVQKAIFLQVLIADCMIEHSGGPLRDQNLSAVLTALHLATQLHLVDLQASPRPRLHALGAPHDAQTVLSSLQPHVVHVLCAVVSETLKTEMVTQWCQVAASALRCLDFVVHTSISCAFEPLVIDTIVQCFNSCDTRTTTPTVDLEGARGEPDLPLDASQAPAQAGFPGVAWREDGKEDLRAALHHLVETCHDVLPSVSIGVLLQAARRLIERILGSQSQRNWPSLHIHLLRLLMRIVVIASGDVAPSLISGLGAHIPFGTSEGTLPFLDYLLWLLSAAPAEERVGCVPYSPSGATMHEASGGLGMPYVGQRCWGILRTHLAPFMPRRDLQLFIRWLACSLSDSRSSYPAAQSLLLAIVADLARAGLRSKAQGAPECEASAPRWLGPDPFDDPPALRVHRAATTVCGADLQPLVRPLHDWLLLLTSKRGALYGENEIQESTAPLPAADAEVLLSFPTGGGSAAGHWRFLSQGLLQSPRRDEDDHGSEDAEPSGWRRSHGHEAAGWHAQPHDEWDVGRSARRDLSAAGPQLLAAAGGAPTHDLAHAGQAQHLLQVWRTLVAVVAALPAASQPSLHALARPLLEEIRQVCLAGSPSRQALQVLVCVLTDLEPCSEQSAVFLKSLLLAFCEWIPHSVLDETFSALDQMLRLIGHDRLDERVTRALTHSMLDQYTSRSKAQRGSQQTFISLLMARRPRAVPSHDAAAEAAGGGPQEAAAADAGGAAQAGHAAAPEAAASSPRAPAGGQATVAAAGEGAAAPPGAVARAEEPEEPASDGEECAGGQEDISHFRNLVELCFPCPPLDVVPGPVGGAGGEGEPAAQDGAGEGGGHDAQGDGEASRPPPAGGAGAEPPAPGGGPERGERAELDLVERLQFLGAVFRAMRYPHLEFLVDQLPHLVGPLREYVTHSLEKVRLLAVDLLQSICSTAFTRYARRWAAGGAGGGDANGAERWRRLLERCAELAVAPLAPGGWRGAPPSSGAARGPGAGTRGSPGDDGPDGGCTPPTSENSPAPPSTPAVVLACCQLLHAARSCSLLDTDAVAVDEGGGTLKERLTDLLVEPLIRITRVPWQLPRVAGLSALLAWAPCLAWGSRPAARASLGAAVAEGLRSGDSLARCAALRLVPTLWQHAANEPEAPGREDVLALQDDWNADVREAAQEVAGWAVAQGGEPLEPGAPLHERLGVVARWGAALYESVYVNEMPTVCREVAARRSTLDRFEDFLDATDNLMLRQARLAKQDHEHFGGGGAGDAEGSMPVDPDPELRDILAASAAGAAAAAAAGAAAGGAGGAVELGGGPPLLFEDQAVAARGAGSRRADELDNEEDLGIIDAGDEEWLEVFDVIREHSAVTIFNNTDSTWYVSSKHPNFVRPLHGKRRHSLGQHRQRSPSPSDVGIVSEGRLAPSPGASPRLPPRRGERPRAGRGGPPCAEGGGRPPAGAASPGALAGRRRPNSAPNRVYSSPRGAGVAAQWAHALPPRQEGGGPRGPPPWQDPPFWTAGGGSCSGNGCGRAIASFSNVAPPVLAAQGRVAAARGISPAREGATLLHPHWHPGSAQAALGPPLGGPPRGAPAELHGPAAPLASAADWGGGAPREADPALHHGTAPSREGPEVQHGLGPQPVSPRASEDDDTVDIDEVSSCSEASGFRPGGEGPWARSSQVADAGAGPSEAAEAAGAGELAPLVSPLGGGVAEGAGGGHEPAAEPPAGTERAAGGAGPSSGADNN